MSSPDFWILLYLITGTWLSIAVGEDDHMARVMCLVIWPPLVIYALSQAAWDWWRAR